MEKTRLWTKQFIIGTIINFLLVLNYYLLMVIMVNYATSRYQTSESIAGLSASMFVIGALLARFFSARLMSKINEKNVLVLAALFEVITSALYFAAFNLPVLLGIRVLHGLSYGMASTAVSTIVTGSIAKERHGEGIGYFMLSIKVGAAIGPFFGMFLIQHGGYSYIFAFCTAAAIICLLSALLFGSSESKPLTEKAPQKPAKGLANIFEIKAIAISVVCAGIYFCYSSIISFLTPYSTSIHLQTAASFFFIVYSIVILVTRPFTGKMYDRKGAVFTMFPAFASFFIGMILLSQAAEEQDENARPELATHIENPDQYDTIILGYPNWWGDMPQPLFTFLEEYDFSGKTIIPFNSHGGSGFSNTIEEIKELQPDANVSDEGLSISRDKVADSAQDVTDWAKSLGLSE